MALQLPNGSYTKTIVPQRPGYDKNGHFIQPSGPAKSTMPKHGEKRKFPDGNTYVHQGSHQWVLDIETPPDGMDPSAWNVLQGERYLKKQNDFKNQYREQAGLAPGPQGNPVTLAPVFRHVKPSNGVAPPVDLSKPYGSLRDFPQQSNPAAPYVDSPFLNDHSVPGTVTKIPNMAWGERHGMVWDGSKWVRKDPTEDLQRQAAEMEMERRRIELDNFRRQNNPAQPGQTSSQSMPEDDIRALIEEGRKQIAKDSARRKAAEQLAQEASGQEVLDSGRPWKWTGSTYEYTDTPEAENAQRAGRQKQIADEQQAFAKQLAERQKLYSNSLPVPPPPSTGGHRPLPILPGDARHVPVPSQGTPYNPQAQAAEAEALVRAQEEERLAYERQMESMRMRSPRQLM
jgi:hypothetical protein